MIVRIFTEGQYRVPEERQAELHELDNACLEVERLSIHTPDLDDVFFAITGRPTGERAVAT